MASRKTTLKIGTFPFSMFVFTLKGGKMELRNENQEAGANNNENLSESSHKTGELFIEKEKFNEDVVDDESDSNIESWGVYFQGKDKTILGLFWDYKLAELFLDSVKKSDFLKKIKETV